MATLPKHDTQTNCTATTKHNTQTNRTVVLDFNGGTQIYRNPELGLNIPAQIEPGEFSAARRAGLVSTLNLEYASQSVRFTTDATPGASAVHIGRTDDFDRYGAFLGLAEGIGEGNAFVLLDDSADDAELVDVIRHEAGHILGTLDHGGTGIARYAWLKEETDYFVAYNAYKDSTNYRRYLRRKTTTSVTYIYLSVPADLQDVTLEYHANGTWIENEYACYERVYDENTNSYVFPSAPATDYIYRKSNQDAYRDGAGLSVTNLTVYGCDASSCKVTGTMFVGESFDYDYQSVNSDWWGANSGLNSMQYGFVYYQGTATACEVGHLIVSGYGTARQCLATSLTVQGALSATKIIFQSGITENTLELHQGLAENCIVTGGTLSVNPGGIARNIVVRSGKADIGMDYFYLEKYTESEVEQLLQDHGNGLATNLIVENGSVLVRYGGELYNATIDGELAATEGAALGGVITCKAVDLSDVTPHANITIKLDLHDYAVPNYTESVGDTLVYYFADYTMKIVDSNTMKVISTGTFDNRDGRFNMKDWKYTFSANIGKVDDLSVGSVVVDFGGTEKDFDEGVIGFVFPSNNGNIPFQLNSNKKNYEVVYTSYTDEPTEASSLIYNGALFGEAADVLWLEYGWNEDVEYTVDLASMMTEATENLTITNADTDNETLADAKIQGATLVVKGGAETANLTVTAEDKDKRDHECDLELIVVPEEIPIFGKDGAKKYSQTLKRMQKDRISKASFTFLNVHTKLYGMDFDLTDTGVTLSVNWTKFETELKVQGKLEWKLKEGVAETGKQLKLVIDLSGDNYISISHKKGGFSWDLVGELKVPDFKLGKFEFSNMWLKLDTSKTAFSASAYVQLPGIKYAFGGDIGIVDSCIDSMHIGADNLKIPLAKTGLLVQSLSGGFSGMATALAISFDLTMGVTFGPKTHFNNLAWLGLGLDDGDFYLAELKLNTKVATDGEYTGTATLSAMGGFFSGEGQLHIYGDDFSVKGTFFMLGKCISITGSLNATDGRFTISGSGSMILPRESKKSWGPLAGTGLSVNAFADFTNRYLVAWSVFHVFNNKFNVGIRYTFDGEVELLGASDLLEGDEFPDTKSLRSSLPQSESVAAPLRGGTPPSASKTFTVNSSGVSLFQFKLSGSGATVSLDYDGAEYTQDAIAAGLYDNMQIVSGLTGADCITIAVNNAWSGQWTMNAYGDADADFGAFTISGNAAPKPVITSITVGADARSTTIGYSLGDLSGLTDVQLSIFRTGKDAEYGGPQLVVIESPAAEGSWEWVMDEEMAGGDYSFYLMVESKGQAPVFSDISDAYTFRTLDTEAPDQIQVVHSEWKSTGTVLTWDEAWDDKGVAGYMIRYTAGDEDMAEADEKTNTFTFDKVPNGTYDFQVAAYDEADNLSAWSPLQSCLVLTVGNAKYKDMTLTESIVLGEYESAAGITAGDFTVTAASNSIVSGSVLGDAGIAGIVENTTIDGTVTLYDGARGYGLTVNGELTLGGAEPVSEINITNVEVLPDDSDDNAAGDDDETPAEEVSAVTFNGAFADGVTVKTGGKLTIGSDATVQHVTVEEGGSLVLEDMADFDQVTLAYRTSLIVPGGKDGSFRLSGDIWTAGTLSTYRMISGGGHKIHFEQYRQTAERSYSAENDYFYDETALLSDMDRILGNNVVEVVIDSSWYGSFKIADDAEYFSGTITVSDYADGSSAKVGFDTYAVVGNALCMLQKKEDDNSLWLLTGRAEIGTPTLSVEGADSNAVDTIALYAAPADLTGPIADCTFRYSLNADMSDAITVTKDNGDLFVRLSKYDLVDNATYYAQVSVRNDTGIQSPWSDAVSFTVTPKLLPDAPPPVVVNGATDAQSTSLSFTAEVDKSDYRIQEYRFRYADNPEMNNAISVTSDQRLINYVYVEKSGIEEGRDYYVQAQIRYNGEWSYWSEAVVFNTEVWDYDGITIGPEPDGDFNYFSLDGKRAKNVTVINGGYFYGGGRVDGLTIETGGFFRDDYSNVTNAVVDGGRYWLDSGSVADIVVNSGELRLMNGSLNGATVGANGIMNLDHSSSQPTIVGTILIQGMMSVYYGHPGLATSAAFVFDLGAHEANKDKAYIDYTSPILGTRTFTVKLDDTPEAGDYRIAYTPNSGEFYAALAAADDTDLGIMGIGMDAIVYGGLYYSLVDQKGVTYLHVSDSDAPAFIGPVKLSKDGAFYDSDLGYDEIWVSDEDECDYVLVGDGGQVFAITVGNGGSVDVFGNVYGATIENGGKLILKEGGCALSDIVTIETGGNVTIEGGKVDLGAAFHLAGGTITVNGALQGWEDDSGAWGPTNHWFVFDLDKFTTPPSGVMISDYSLLQCNPMFTVTVADNQAAGEYKLVGNAASFTETISVSCRDDDWPEYLGVGGGCKINDMNYALSVIDDVLTLSISAASFDDTAPSVPSGLQVVVVDQSVTLSWSASMDDSSGVRAYIVTYSHDGQEFSLMTAGTTLVLENVDFATWQWSVTAIDNAGNASEEAVGEAFTVKEAVGPEPRKYNLFSGCFAGNSQAMLANEDNGIVTIYANGMPWGMELVLDPGWKIAGVGDFNADGRDDFLRVNGEGYVVGEMAQADGTFIPQVLNFKNPGWSILGTGDFNGNGSDDVLIANPTAASETVGLLGYWESGVTWTLINGYSAEWEIIATGDFNNDGKCDMLWRNSFVGEGDLTYNAFCTWIVEDPVDWRMVSVANPTEWNFLCAGDFNADGANDIAMINDVGVVGIWGVEDGWLSSWSILSAVDTSAWTLAGVGDFNADGTDDIAWVNNASGMAGYWQIKDKNLASWQNIATIS